MATRKCKNACLACSIGQLWCPKEYVVDKAWEIVIREVEHRFQSWLSNTETAMALDKPLNFSAP